MHCAYISIPTFKLIQRYSPNVAMYLAEIVLHVMYLYQLLCKGSKSLRRNIYMCCQPSKRDWLHRFLQSVICSSTKDLLLANHRCKLFSTKKLLFFQIRVNLTIPSTSRSNVQFPYFRWKNFFVPSIGCNCKEQQ